MTHPINLAVALFVLISLMYVISGRDNYKKMNSMKIFYILVSAEVIALLFNLYAAFMK